MVKILLRYMFACLTCLTLSGCDLPSLTDGPDNSSMLMLHTPAIIKRVRVIETENLKLDVTVNGTKVDMQNQGDVWTGTAWVPFGDVASIELLWSEFMPDFGEPLRLAVYRHTTGPITSNLPLPLDARGYDRTVFDDDNDGIYNLDERASGTDPLVFTSSEDTTTEETQPDFIDVGVKRINPSIRPDIDGVYETSIWENNATWVNTDGENLAIDNLVEGYDNARADGDTEFSWGAMHDMTYLYLFVSGEFADASNQSMHVDSDGVWDDDTLEIYLDGDNSKDSSPDGTDDFQLFIPLLKKQLPFAANNINHSDHRIYAGTSDDISAPWPDGIDFVNSFNKPHWQHTWEIRIELSKVGITVGEPFGIELQYSDDQDGGRRDAKWAWKGVTSDGWKNPSLLGTAILQ